MTIYLDISRYIKFKLVFIVLYKFDVNIKLIDFALSHASMALVFFSQFSSLFKDFYIKILKNLNKLLNKLENCRKKPTSYQL